MHTDEREEVTEIPLAELRRRGIVRIADACGEVLVALVDGAVKAYDGVCPHLGGPLLDATIRGERITCPWHGYEWSLRSGECFTVPGRNWDGVEGHRRQTTPYSGRLTPICFELTEQSVRLKRRTS